MSPENQTPRDTKHRRWLFVVLIVGGVFLITFGLFLHSSSSPEFCKSCHFMETYYQSWSRSTHNQFACGKCHYPPGFKGYVIGKYKAIAEVAMYITGRYHDEPHTEVPDENCLQQGCHDQRLQDKDVTFRGISFSHTKHLTQEVRGKHLRCTSCHSQIVQGEHITVTETTCFLCHFKPTITYPAVSDCRTCHEPPTQDIEYQGVVFNHKDVLDQGAECQMCHVDVVQGTGEVPQERCFACHDKPERLARYNDRDFLHENHVTGHKVDCLNCHLMIKHQKKKISHTLDIDCQQCHPDHHAAQRELYMGAGGKNVDPEPAAMFLARVSCQGCHIRHRGDEVQGFTETATAESCARCHGESYKHIEAQWSQGIARLLEQIKPSVQLVADEFKRLGSKVPASARQLYESAAHNVQLVSYGKGVHNVQYAQRLLLQANSDLAKALQLAQSARQLPQVEFAQQGNNCKNCHFGIETKSLEIYGRHFEHGRHLLDAKLNCDVCHSNQPKGQPGHGETPITADQCLQCHHQTSQAKCVVCHDTLPENKPYEGKSTFDHTLHVSQQGLDCEACHQSDTSQRFKADCVTCHHDTASVQVAERCASCHAQQTEMFTGSQYARPSLKAEAGMSCNDCHTKETGSLDRATRRSCALCHTEGGDYAAMMDSTQQRIGANLTAAREKSAKVQALLRVTPSPELSRRLSEVTRSVQFVEGDRSRGIHNPELADDLLNRALTDLDQLLQQAME